MDIFLFNHLISPHLKNLLCTLEKGKHSSIVQANVLFKLLFKPYFSLGPLGPLWKPCCPERLLEVTKDHLLGCLQWINVCWLLTLKRESNGVKIVREKDRKRKRVRWRVRR